MKSDITKIKSKYISLGIKKAQNLYITADFGKIIGKENLNVETLKNILKQSKKLSGQKEQ